MKVWHSEPFQSGWDVPGTGLHFGEYQVFVRVENKSAGDGGMVQAESRANVWKKAVGLLDREGVSSSDPLSLKLTKRDMG
jgi:hypothetical protein